MVDLEASSCNASLLIASTGFVHRMAVRLIRKGSFTSASSRLQSLHASLSAQQALKSGLKEDLVSRVWDCMALFMGLGCVGKVFMGLLYRRRQST